LYPYLKTGGLADVGAGLPPALRELGCDVRLLMPAFRPLTQRATTVRRVGALPTADVVLAHLDGMDAPLYLIQAPALYDRPGNPYLGPDGNDWHDNAARFALLGRAAAALGDGLDPKWVPDVIHGHDWHAGLAPAYVRALAQRGHATPATVFTIHNLAYQGLFPHDTFPSLGLPAPFFGTEGIEFFGQVSFMKAALRLSDHITTVSPTYAQEIMSSEHGMGLDGLLRARADVVSGILNGVDYRVWSPATDDMAEKVSAKRALQTRFGLQLRAQSLVLGVVSRLTVQKGLHLLPEIIADVVHRGGQLLVLGQGDTTLEQAFADAAARHPGQMGVRLGYDEATAHAVVAGADVMLVPSAFEPCGLTQLYGLRYGSLPLVRRVGGLADTVVDCTLENLEDGSATGFVFDALNADALLGAVRRAFALYHQPQAWAKVQKRGMALRFDWQKAAHAYQGIYQSLRPALRNAA
jgi:starch synthase